jgi:hypothetical protein
LWKAVVEKVGTVVLIRDMENSWLRWMGMGFRRCGMTQ